MQQPGQISQSEFEKTLIDTENEYTKNKEELEVVETEMRDLETKSFSLLQNLYRQVKHTDRNLYSALKDLEIDYQNSLSDLENKRKDLVYKQSMCLRSLAKVRSLQQTYLMGIINGLKVELKDLKDTAGQVKPRDDNVL